MGIRKTLLATALVLGGVVCAQSVRGQYRPADVPAKARKWYEQAQQMAAIADSQTRAETLQLLEKAIEKAPRFLDAYALMASLYVQQRAYSQALAGYDKAAEIDSQVLLPAYANYAKAAAGTGDFTRALQLIDRYLQQSRLSEKSRQQALQWKANYAFGKSSAQLHLPFDPVNLGDSVNSPDAEYFPNLTIDGQTLVFTRNLQGRNEDFFVSHLNQAGRWGPAQPLTALSFGPDKRGINTRDNEGAETISQDGRLLLFTICDRSDGLGSCDIYYSFRTPQGWSEARNIGPPINSPAWESQPSLSPDQRDLYFVSNRSGGKGGSDIYVSHLQADGRWGPPVNLGDSVNTSGDESSPFIHADNRSLYFASNGRVGVGGEDLYFARKKLDGSWGEARNMGYPINTIDHDGSIFVDAGGQTAYLASDRKDSRGKLDLYKFTLYPAARPVMTLYVHGRVFNQKTHQPVQAAIVLTDLKTGTPLTTLSSDPRGIYLITLPVGRAYAFQVRKPGFLFYSAHFALQADSVKWRPYAIDIPLQPLETGASVVLHNIFFDFDQYTLRPESDGELNSLLQLLRQNPQLSIRINGYTDSVGTAAHNQQLSQQRAQAVVDYLLDKGIAPERLQAKGFGATHPVADNATAQGRAQNRRTEVEIIKAGTP